MQWWHTVTTVTVRLTDVRDIPGRSIVHALFKELFVSSIGFTSGFVLLKKGVKLLLLRAKWFYNHLQPSNFLNRTDSLSGLAHKFILQWPGQNATNALHRPPIGRHKAMLLVISQASGPRCQWQVSCWHKVMRNKNKFRSSSPLKPHSVLVLSQQFKRPPQKLKVRLYLARLWPKPRPVTVSIPWISVELEILVVKKNEYFTSLSGFKHCPSPAQGSP